MQQFSKPLRTQAVYLLAILCGVLGAFLLLYLMGTGKQDDSSKSISSPAPISDNEKRIETSLADAGEKAVRAPAAKNLLETLLKLDPNAAWQVSEHPDGRPSHILGGHIPCADRDCDARSVTQILETIAAALDVESKNLKISESRIVSNVYELEQYFAGYRVFNASIKAFSNASRTEIYHVTNELRKIEAAETNILVSKAQAVEKFTGQLLIADPTRVLFVVDKPIIVGTSPTNNSLVWWLQYGQRGPVRRSVDAFLNATTGEITIRSDTK